MNKRWLKCPNGCFSIVYKTPEDVLPLDDPDPSHDRDDAVDADTFLNELGPPVRIGRQNGQCPACGADVRIHGDGDD